MPIPKQVDRQLAAQFLKFGVVGGVSFVVDTGLLFLMYSALRWNGELMSQSLGRWLVEHHLALFPPDPSQSTEAFLITTRKASLLVFQPISAGIAIVNSFFLNRKWTFGIETPDARRSQFRRFVSLYVGSLVIGSLALSWVSTFMPVLPAKVLITVVMAFMNFAGQRFWTFKER